MGKLIAIVATLSVPLSIGMGYVVQAMFPAMNGNTAGLVGGAITVPAIFIAFAIWEDA